MTAKGKGKIILLLFLFLGIVIFASPVYGYVMSSSNYRIQSDSLNMGGGLGSSTNYIVEDTVGEISSGFSSSTSYSLSAGYQAMQATYISISSPADVVLLPNIPGLTGGTASGTAAWNVITDSYSGYSLSIKASSTTAIAMKCASGGCSASTDYFSNYSLASSPTADFSWLIDLATSSFGFTAQGDNLVSAFLDNSSACGVGSTDTPDRCWYPFSTSNKTIVTSYSSNHPSGKQTTVKFQAESGVSHSQPSGNYQAEIVVTAVVN